MLQRSNELGIVEQEGSADRGDGPAHARVAILIFRQPQLFILGLRAALANSVEGPPLRRVRGRSLGPRGSDWGLGGGLRLISVKTTLGSVKRLVALHR